jgi:hypothetical protein
MCKNYRIKTDSKELPSLFAEFKKKWNKTQKFLDVVFCLIIDEE